MAGDWIKVECVTPDKPEVRKIARLLSIKSDEAFGKVVRFWIWIDGNCVDGYVDGVVSTDVDDIFRQEGFSGALVSVGWAEFDDEAERVTIPNFEDHNGKSAKSRGLKAKRQKNYRANVDAGVDGSASTDAPPEKRREEKSNTSSKEEVVDDHKYNEDDLTLAIYILKKIIEVVPKTRSPNIEKWADTIRLMREQNKYTHSEICKVFVWANANSFWSLNILSPKKLRDKFPELSAKMEQSNGNSNQSTEQQHSTSTTGRNSESARNYREKIQEELADLEERDDAVVGVAG